MLVIVGIAVWVLGDDPMSDAPSVVRPPRESVRSEAGLAPETAGPGGAATLPVAAAPDEATPLATPSAPTVRVTGRVVTEDGLPVAGARVHLFADPPPVPEDTGFGIREARSWSDHLDTWWHEDLALEDVGPPRRIDLVAEELEPRLVETTGPDGTFSVEAPVLVATGQRGPRPFLLVAHPDFAEGFARLQGESLETGTVQDIVLTAGATLRGRVVDPSGRPVSGAVVRFGREWWYSVARVLETDASGAFAFPHVRADPHELRVEHPGSATRFRGHLKITEDTDLGDVGLAAGGAITGRVLAADGAPVARAHVLVTTEPLDGREMHPLKVEFEPDEDSILLELDVDEGPQTGHAVTDTDGRFRIDGRTFANHTLYARHPDHDPVRVRDVLPGPPPGTSFDVRLGERHDALLRVTDLSGAPVVDVDVRAWRLLGRSGGRRIPVVAVDREAGLHRLQGLGFRDTYVQASAPGFAAATWTFPPEEVAEQEVLVRTLEAGYAIDAKVVDEDGAPLEGWNLGVSQPTEPGGIAFRSRDAEDTGPAFRFEGLPAGEFQVHAWPPRFGNDRMRPEPVLVSIGPDAPVATCTLVSRIGATLEGAITSPDPEPRWQSVMLAKRGETPSYSGPRDGRNQYAPDRYRIKYVPEGEWVVWFDGREVGTVTLVAGETTKLDLHAPAQERITGVVTADGVPIAGVRVDATYAGERGAGKVTAETGADGRFEVLVPMVGPWAVGVVAPGASKYQRPITKTTVEVAEHGVARCDLALPVGRVRVRVVHEDGEPFAERKVWLRHEPEGSMGAVPTNDRGEVVFEHVPAGRWRVQVARSGAWASADGAGFDVPADDRLVDAPVLVAPRGFAIHGSASVAPGLPAPAGAKVRLWDVSRDEFVWSHDVVDQHYRFEGLTPGRYRVALFREDRDIYDDETGHLGTEVTITDADVEVDLVGAVDDG